MTDKQELQVKQKQELVAATEQTRPGLVFTPAVDIFETDRGITLLADMPGTASDAVKVDLRDGVLTVSGEVKPFEGKDEADVLIEFEIGRYVRQFVLSEAIDQDRIEATFAHGVLRLVLPKAEAALPRRIEVKVA